MGKILALLAMLLLLFGCPYYKEEGQETEQEEPVLLPKSNISYTAHYIVTENGQQGTKTVFRAKENLRVDIGEFSLFFINSSAYSCSRIGQKPECYKVGLILSEQEFSLLSPFPPLPAAQEIEAVKIWQTIGKCFLVPHAILEKRKLCFTDTGILAYDEYRAQGGAMHIEYLEELEYSVDKKEFELPAVPQKAK